MANQTLANRNEASGMWNETDIALIRATVAKGADDSEFKLFMYMAHTYELDPLIKQIWLIKYGNQPAAIYTSRDGFLSIAHRSNQFDGMQTKAVRDDKGNLIGAVCRVWRKDMTHPFEVEVSLDEYNTGKSNWQKMPETMIKKVAESQCLRRAFNISGLYDTSEYEPEISSGKRNQPIEGVIEPVGNQIRTALVPEEEPLLSWAEITEEEYNTEVETATNGGTPEQARAAMGYADKRAMLQGIKQAFPDYETPRTPGQIRNAALMLIKSYFVANPEDKLF